MSEPLLPRINSPADLKKLPVTALPALATEIRQVICDQVSRSGGHFAPNLGVVELTIALHYVFDFGHDRLLFDVGHQCYPHKLLTGRQHLFARLRQRDGMAGFPEPRESNFDLFSVGHAGTAISTATGMARADTILKQGDRRVVALVGDASIVNGVSMEGINSAGTLRRQFLIVLNDNGMSIAKPQGALAKNFDRLRVNPHYEQLKQKALQVLQYVPGGETVEDVYHRASEAMKSLVYPHHMFSQFGLLCIGPTDGHDLAALIDVLDEVKDFDRPVLLHCKTIKGKGFDFSTGDPTTFHSPKPFTIAGCHVELKKTGRSFTAAFADALIDVMERDEAVFAVTAAMPDGTGINQVLPRFPERSLDTGICESHTMDMCAGMAKAGLKPFFTVYSTFSQRALDQMFQEVALQGLPVRVCMDRAGYVGGDGAIHHGFMDVSMFRVFPDAALLAASDEPNLRASLEFMRTYDSGPSFLRYPRDTVASEPLQADVPPFVLGKANLVRPAHGPVPRIAVLAYGTRVYAACKAIASLGPDGDDIAVYDARFAKPVDTDLLASLTAQGVPILTVEDHTLTGGFGAALLEAANLKRLDASLIFRLGMPEQWVYQGTRPGQLAEAGIDADGIARQLADIAAHLAPPVARPVPLRGLAARP
ncbi:MAG: 1-deoxy-D-xylulose-5-phosphate synthase [Acidobacteriota bacterium]